MKRCPSCGEENADRARFCQACASPLAEAGEPAAEVRKVVTIVFADVTGSTSLGEHLDPEALRRVMGRYFDRMAAVIEQHGGTVEKFIGDAVMAVFGVPRLHEDDALRAVRAAEGMRRALEDLNADLERDHGVGLRARIGVNTGEVVAGDPSAGQRLVTGDAVNVAARLEQAATPGEVLLGEATYQLVRDAVEVAPAEDLELKGKAEPVPAFRLISVREDVAGHERRLDSPMVGRAKELEMLERALERALTERTSHLFTLLGPAGVGKSRLVQEFLAGSAASATALRGRCLSYGEGITFFPLAEVVQQAAGVSQADDLAAARSKLERLLEGAEGSDRIVPAVAGLLAWDEPGATEDAFWGVRKLLEHLARDRPVVVVFDDIHWAEPTFLDLIDHLADWTRDAALLLVCVARPELLELRPGWAGGKMNATTILLEPLDGEAASSLVDHLLGRAEIPLAARSRILEAAEGNPLFVEEMLGMLIDDGLLRLEGGAWVAAEDLADITVPPTIQLLLAARLDRLDSEERAVIERGAVEGKIFHAGAVATLASETLRPQVPSRLLALARKELIRPDRAEFAGEDAFRFRHLLIRDAAYHAMPKEQRADLHERFAAWLERAAGERVAEYEEILGYHLEQAYRYRVELGPPDDRAARLARRAVKHLMTSAERGRERGDSSGARQLLRRAVDLAEGHGRSNALLTLALTLGELNDFQEGGRIAQEAIAAARAHGDRATELRAELVLTESKGQTDPSYSMARTREEVEAVLAELQRLGDEEGIVQGLLAAARTAFFEGSCERMLEIVIPLSERPGLSTHHRREIALNVAVAGYFGPASVGEAFRLLDRAVAIAPDGIFSDVFAAHTRLLLLSMQGRAEEVWAEIDRTDTLWNELGSGPDLARYQGLAEAERFLGRSSHAEDYLRTAVERFDALGETGYNSTITAQLALVLCEQGRFEEAERYAARARELSAEDDFATQSTLRMAQALILSSKGEHQAALNAADEAVSILDPTDYLAWQAEGQFVRGTVLAAAGRVDEARSAFHEALARYDRKGVVPAAARTRERIAALDGS